MRILICLMIFAMLLPSVSAIVLDFEEIPTGNCNGLSTSITSQGFQFTQGNSTSIFFSCNPGIIASNTTPAIIENSSISNPIMALISGGAFSVQSFDAGARNNSNGATSLLVTGQKLGGGTVSTTVNFNGQAFDTFNLSSFTNLTSFSMLAQRGGNPAQFIFDNIVVNEAAAVPEPASIVFLGIALMAFVVRQKS